MRIIDWSSDVCSSDLPFMGPITSGLGEIYQYTIDPKPGYDTVYSDREIRTVQDWIVKRQMAMVRGVVEVNGFGGHIKQYEVAVNPELLGQATCRERVCQ